MGAGVSVLPEHVQHHLKKQFEQLRGDKDYLVIHELLHIEPIADVPITLGHIPTVFVVDADRDGRITLKELEAFSRLCVRLQGNYRRQELQQHLQGHCTVKLFEFLNTDTGVDEFVQWFVRLFIEDTPSQQFSESPGVSFVSRDTAHLMHSVLGVEGAFGYDSQSFLDMLQRVGEEVGLMHLADEPLDDSVPIEVIERFAKHFALGYKKLYQSLNLGVITLS